MGKIIGSRASAGHTVPGVPTSVSASNNGTNRLFNNGRADVSFTAPTDTGKLPITSYTVTSTPGSFTGTGASSPISVTGLQSNVAYTYVVTATNSTGTSAGSTASAAVTATTVPATMSAPTATNPAAVSYTGTGRTSVSFVAPSTGGSNITGYTVTSSSGLTGTGSSSPITVTGETLGVSRTYTVTATNTNGTSVASSASNSSTPSTVPDRPTIGTATAGNAQATVTFTAPANNGGSAITSYTVTSSPGNLTATGSGSPLTVTGLTNGTSYTFTVTATNANGTSLSSTPASNSVTPVAPIPYFMNITGDGNENYGLGVGKDTSGNYYLCGYFSNSQSWLGKYNSNGALQWQRALDNTTTRTNLLWGINADSSGNVYASGYYYTGSTARTGYIVKYNTSGTYQWGKVVSPFVGQFYSSILDSSANVIAVGVYRQSDLNFDWYVVKFDTSGNLLWAKTLGMATQFDEANVAAVDTSNNIFVAGTFTVSSSFRTGVAKYNSSGTLQWQLANNQSSSYGYGIATDSSGNILVSGRYYDGSGDRGTVTKFDTSGNLLWQRQISGATLLLNGIATDAANNVYVVGQDYSSTTTTIIFKYNSSGTIQWQRRLRSGSGSITPGNYNSIKVDSSGNLTIAAVNNFSVAVTRDMMLFSLPGDGSKTGTYNITIGGNTFAIVYEASSYTDSANSASFSNPSASETTPTEGAGNIALAPYTTSFTSATTTI